jgi:hypothetical protein
MSGHNISIEEAPPWETPFSGFLYVVEQGLLVGGEEVAMEEFVKNLVRRDILEDLGELQRYLRGLQASVQLVAYPFDEEKFEGTGMGCVDINTGEPRGHFLSVAAGHRDQDETEVYARLRELFRSHKANESTLRRDTGFLVDSAVYKIA